MSILSDATEYTFQGDGITASFFPKGAGGPIIEGRPETFFVYQDHHLSKTFGRSRRRYPANRQCRRAGLGRTRRKPDFGWPCNHLHCARAVGRRHGEFAAELQDQVGYHGSSGHLGAEARIPGASDLQGGAPRRYSERARATPGRG